MENGKARILFLVLGIVIGVVLSLGITAVYVRNNADQLMITVGESKFDFQTTIDEVNASVIAADGWKVAGFMNMTKSLASHGYEINQAVIFEICNPDIANEMLADEDNLWMVAMMPCRIAIYEKSDGKVYVAGMNMELMSKLFPGDIGDAMEQVAADDVEMLEDILH